MNNPVPLRDLVAHRLEAAMRDLHKTHPHLAAAINRITLIDTTVRRLEDDPEYRRAMDQAARDEAFLHASARLIALIDRAIVTVMGL
jgi:hypothetical protein